MGVSWKRTIGALAIAAGAAGLLAASRLPTAVEASPPPPVKAGAHPTARTIRFSRPTFVDYAEAGGEPSVIHSTRFGDLVYSAHEGTTHIDRAGLTGVGSVFQFLCPDLFTLDCAKNHVWIWTSSDGGLNWDRRDEGLAFQGYSDPDLTQDQAGTIYDTGIDRFNDSIFSSQDGGKTWPHGTINCHEGDRPWLAGGKSGQLFMSTDTDGSGHEVFFSDNFGRSCHTTGILDNGNFTSAGHHGGYSGFGKMVYDPFDGSIIEPARFTNTDDGGSTGVGISRLADAAQALRSGHGSFQPVEVASRTSVYSPFGAPTVMSMDSAENIYFAWGTDDRKPGTKGGCSTSTPNVSGGSAGSPTPLPNHIMFVAGKHIGPLGSGEGWQFSAPIDLASQGNARVLWPWTVAGSDGNVSVVWYQMDKLVDPDCDAINGAGTLLRPGAMPDVKTYIYETQITDATDPVARTITGPTNASGRYIHMGGICDSGTTCFVTGQDRRLGDYFTNSIDPNGCVIIASGDTTVPDLTGGPRITSLPIFMKQIGGPSLTTGRECGGP